MHGIMLFHRQAHQVPQAIGILREILRGPDMVDSLGRDLSAVARRLPALVAITAKGSLTQPSPAFVFSGIIKAHSKTKEPEPPIRAKAQAQRLRLNLSCCPGKTKSPSNVLPSLGIVAQARRLRLLVLTSEVNLHFLQNKGKSINVVVSKIRCCVLAPQIGQTALPSSTRTISHLRLPVNTFCSISRPPYGRIYITPSQKNMGLYVVFVVSVWVDGMGEDT